MSASQICVYVYPVVTDTARLRDLLLRLSWYMAPHISGLETIFIAAPENSLPVPEPIPQHFDQQIGSSIPQLLDKVTLLRPEALEETLRGGDPTRDVLFLHDVMVEEDPPQALANLIAAFRRNGGVYRVDAERTRQEGSFFLWSGLNKFCDEATLRTRYQSRFDKMRADIGLYDKAHVFGTGPGFSDYIADRDFSDCLTIAANSICTNTEALERLKPGIICAADPIYHAGCSSYAGDFRTDLVAALERTGAWFVCPLRDTPIYETCLPEHLRGRIVGIPFATDRGIPVDLSETYHLYPFPNVLTLMLLPLAATFGREVHIAGCDGRLLLDDAFFWSHDKTVQINERMNDIQTAHPGFFKIDYNDYYLDHCRDLERVLAEIENSGRKVVNGSPSRIPALQHRQSGTTPAAQGPVSTFVMMDPDAKDGWGHFLAYDKRVAEAVKASGLDFFLLCRAELEDQFLEFVSPRAQKVFTKHSWTVGNQKAVKRADVLQFAAELDAGLRAVEEAVPEGRICLFFYVGSLEVAEMVEFLLSDHPRVEAVINLFWSYNYDQSAPEYTQRWAAITQRMNAHPRLHLMHSTEQIAVEFAHDWGLQLPVLKHPSTTFSDEEARALAAVTPAVPTAGGTRVLFPGGARAEKGFVLGLEAAALLQGRDIPFEVTVRARLDRVSGPRLHEAFEGLDKSGLTISDGDLSDAEFIATIDGSDVVVIPYLEQAFRRRTSGILVDALLLNKPIVVCNGTWLADIVATDGIGLSVAPEPQAICDAVLQILRDPAPFMAAIAQAKQAYLAHNSWHVLVEEVVGQATPATALVTPPLEVEAGPQRAELERLRAEHAAVLETLLQSQLEIANRDQRLEQMRASLDDMVRLIKDHDQQIAESHAKLDAERHRANAAEAHIGALLNARSWRITAPLRYLSLKIRR